LLAAYAFARTMGAGERNALLAAIVVASTPAVANAVTAAYVDNSVLAFFIVGALFLERFRRGSSLPDAVIAALALGLAAAVKLSMLPLLGVALIFIVGCAAAQRAGRGRRLALAALFGAIGLAVCTVEYAATWRKTGSPIYPYSLVVSGHELIAGNEELTLLYSGRLQPPAPKS